MLGKVGRAALACAASVALGAVQAHDPVVPADASAAAQDVPLHPDLGSHTYRVDTRVELAQRYFDQGLRLAWAFNHGEALRSFRAAEAADPACAMCAWGQAFVLGPNINAGMDAAGQQAVREALARAAGNARDPKEQALVAALAERYGGADGAERAALNQAYADALRAVAERWPDDPEIGVLYVDAEMNVRPWDYWEADGVTPKERIDDAVRVAERVLEANPDHPGAIHLYIHLTEASARPERAEPYADKLAALMPGAGHLVHMPGHVYYRVGRYRDSAATNIEAVRVDEASFTRMEVLDLYRYGYYPHNIHFVVVSAQMAGDGATALAYAERLAGKIPDAVAETVGWVQVIRAAPYFAHAQFSDPETTLALPDPGDRFPYLRAMWHYARGVAAAARGDGEAARAEQQRIRAIGETADFAMLLAWAVPAPDLLALAEHVLEARIAQARGAAPAAVAAFRRAVAIQDRLAYMEPPYWYYPVRQSLGAALLAAGQPQAAIEVLERSLERQPNNVYALAVLERAQRAAGDTGAQRTARRLGQASIAGFTVPELERI